MSIFKKIHKKAVKYTLLFIRGYQYFLSPLSSPCCRFYPSCSSYGIVAISSHGLLKGLFLLFIRVLRCNRWSSGGYDPVPTKAKPECHRNHATGECK